MAGLILSPGQYYLGGNTFAGGTAEAFQRGAKSTQDMLAQQQTMEMGQFAEQRARTGEQRAQQKFPLDLEKLRGDIALTGAQTGMVGAQTAGLLGTEAREQEMHPHNIANKQSGTLANRATAAQGFASANRLNVLTPGEVELQRAQAAQGFASANRLNVLTPGELALQNAQAEQARASAGLAAAQANELNILGPARLALFGAQAAAANAAASASNSQAANIAALTGPQVDEIRARISRSQALQPAEVESLMANAEAARANALQTYGRNARENATLAAEIELRLSQAKNFMENAKATQNTSEQARLTYVSEMLIRDAMFRQFQADAERTGNMQGIVGLQNPYQRVLETLGINAGGVFQEGGTVLFGGAAQRPDGRIDPPARMMMTPGEQYAVPAIQLGAPQPYMPMPTWAQVPAAAPVPQQAPLTPQVSELDAAGRHPDMPGVQRTGQVSLVTPAMVELAQRWNFMSQPEKQAAYDALTYPTVGRGGQAPKTFAGYKESRRQQAAGISNFDKFAARMSEIAQPGGVPTTGMAGQLPTGETSYTVTPAFAQSAVSGARDRVAMSDALTGSSSSPAAGLPPTAVPPAGQAPAGQAPAGQAPASRDATFAAAMDARNNVLALNAQMQSIMMQRNQALAARSAEAFAAVDQKMNDVVAQIRSQTGAYAAASLRLGDLNPAADVIKQLYPGATVARAADNSIYVSYPTDDGKRQTWRGSSEELASQINAALNPAVKAQAATMQAFNLDLAKETVKNQLAIQLEQAKANNNLRSEAFLAQLKASLRESKLEARSVGDGSGNIVLTDPGNNQVGMLTPVERVVNNKTIKTFDIQWFTTR